MLYINLEPQACPSALPTPCLVQPAAGPGHGCHTHTACQRLGRDRLTRLRPPGDSEWGETCQLSDRRPGEAGLSHSEARARADEPDRAAARLALAGRLAAVQACKLHALGVERGFQVATAAPSVAVTQAVADDSVT